MSLESSSLEHFDGSVRLFPLPNLVLFPHVAQPLHIFEPRYRAMMADALQSDRLLGMALLRPGWEEDYHKRPPLHPMVCVGQIFDEKLLPDGRYDLMLRGVCRGRILEELATPHLYRTARVELCPDQPVASSDLDLVLRRELRARVLPFFAAKAEAQEQVRSLLESNLTLGAVSDIFGFALPLGVEVKQHLLETASVQERVERLLSALQTISPAGAATTPKRRFPPDFSCN
ncbi:MAG: LON peptidase substrate-binding domain-containing protein [Gemmataceae bacterium]